jgi:hypothetical protein
VFAPSGNWEFRTAATQTKGIGTEEWDNFIPWYRTPDSVDGLPNAQRTLEYQAVLVLPPGVQLRGDWGADPLYEGVRGTILEVRVGRDAPGITRMIPTWWVDAMDNSVVHATYEHVPDRFIELNAGAGVTNVSIWHPNQNIDDITPYPWTFVQEFVNSATIENVTLVNSYLGFLGLPSHTQHHILNSYMTALHTGIQIFLCLDIGRAENVHISPAVWANSGLQGAPALEYIREHTRAYATAFKMHRSDWQYVYGLEVWGSHTAVWVGRAPGFTHAPNAQFFNVHLHDNVYGIYAQDISVDALMVSNSIIGGDTAVYIYRYFRGSAQFNGVEFFGAIVSDGSGGVISFENCTFHPTYDYNVRINGGTALLTQSEFLSPRQHVYSGAGLVRALNSGYGDARVLRYTVNSGGAVTVYHDDSFIPPIPTDIRTDIAVHPRPPLPNVLRVDLPRAHGLNADSPTVCVSSRLQRALDYVAAAGGGTVFLPGGRYLVNAPIVIPSGVELRGTFDVQHHTAGGGTTIVTAYTGGAYGIYGAPLIQVRENAGMRGLTLYQMNTFDESNFRWDAVYDHYFGTIQSAPFLMQGQGAGVYFINITVAIGYKGLDLFTYNTSGHYVEYFSGMLLRAGIWVGGGSEGGFVRNMQLNPTFALITHDYGLGISQNYWLHTMRRIPYPNPDELNLLMISQETSNALRLGDVSNQTVFNNFVYGSLYGLQFVRDANGNYPGEIIIIGHGSDGCTFTFYVESAGADTRIIAINSKLCPTMIPLQPIRSYLAVGLADRGASIHPDAEIILYNTSGWGTPTIGVITYGGIVRLHQANIRETGQPGIDVRGGSVYVHSSFFSNPRTGNGNNAHVRLRATGNRAVISNNFFAGLGWLGLSNDRHARYASGTDIRQAAARAEIANYITLPAALESEGFTFWTPTAQQLANARFLIVEYAGNLSGGFAFVRFGDGVAWTMFDNNNARVGAEPGRLMFDLHGLPGNQIGFAFWNESDNNLITRVILATE